MQYFSDEQLDDMFGLLDLGQLEMMGYDNVRQVSNSDELEDLLMTIEEDFSNMDRDEKISELRSVGAFDDDYLVDEVKMGAEETKRQRVKREKDEAAMDDASTDVEYMREHYAENQEFQAPYVGSGALMDIHKDTGLDAFTPGELTHSSAIHGDFDQASLNYSGHQNLEVRRAETWHNFDDMEYILLSMLTDEQLEEEYGDYMRDYGIGRKDLPQRLEDDSRTNDEAEYLRDKYMDNIEITTECESCGDGDDGQVIEGKELDDGFFCNKCIAAYPEDFQAETFEAASTAPPNLAREKSNLRSAIRDEVDSNFEYNQVVWGPYWVRFEAANSNKWYGVLVYDNGKGVYRALGGFGGMGQNPRLADLVTTRSQAQAESKAKAKLKAKERKGYFAYSAEFEQLSDAAVAVSDRYDVNVGYIVAMDGDDDEGDDDVTISITDDEMEPIAEVDLGQSWHDYNPDDEDYYHSEQYYAASGEIDDKTIEMFIARGYILSPNGDPTNPDHWRTPPEIKKPTGRSSWTLKDAETFAADSPFNTMLLIRQDVVIEEETDFQTLLQIYLELEGDIASLYESGQEKHHLLPEMMRYRNQIASRLDEIQDVVEIQDTVEMDAEEDEENGYDGGNLHYYPSNPVCFICGDNQEDSPHPMMSTIGGDACKPCAEAHGYTWPDDMVYMRDQDLGLDAETTYDSTTHIILDQPIRTGFKMGAGWITAIATIPLFILGLGALYNNE